MDLKHNDLTTTALLASDERFKTNKRLPQLEGPVMSTRGSMVRSSSAREKSNRRTNSLSRAARIRIRGIHGIFGFKADTVSRCVGPAAGPPDAHFSSMCPAGCLTAGRCFCDVSPLQRVHVEDLPWRPFVLAQVPPHGCVWQTTQDSM